MFLLVSVKCIDATTHHFYVERCFQVTFKDKILLVRQWHYMKWPDHGVPVSPGHILEFISLNLSQSPVVVHCSAGVGRTGTFCTIWTAVKHGVKDIMEIAEIIATFKHQRHLTYTVETPAQYRFILDALEIKKEA